MSNEIKMLIVEDNPGDVKLIKKAFEKRLNSKTTFHVIRDGQEALDYVSALDNHSKFFPDLILLDLNLPKVNGKDILKVLKNQKSTHAIPVVVFSSSTLKSDISDVYEAHGNCYVNKPMDFTKYQSALLSMREFWFEVVHRGNTDEDSN